MITKNEILKMVKSIAKRGQGRQSTRLIHPVRDWMTGLSIAVVLFISASVYAAYTFLTFSNSLNESVFIESSVISYEQKKAKTVLDTYHERSLQFEKMRADKSNIVRSSIIEEGTEELGTDESGELADDGDQG